MSPCVDPKCIRAASCAGEIYRTKLTFTQQIAMRDVVGAPERSHYFASVVNTARLGESGAWDIDSRKLAPRSEENHEYRHCHCTLPRYRRAR